MFVDAVVPHGGSRLDEMERDDPEFAAELRRLEGGGRFPQWTPDDLAAIVPDADTRRTICRELRPRGIDFFTEPIPVFDGWPDAPCAYVRFSAAYDATARAAAAAGWPVRWLDAGHFHPQVDPEGVAAVVAEVAVDPAVRRPT